MLQGGVEYNKIGGIGTPLGAFAQQVNKNRDEIKEGFGDLAQGLNNNALAASSYRPTFNPNMLQMPQAQFIQSNLYNRIMG